MPGCRSVGEPNLISKYEIEWGWLFGLERDFLTQPHLFGPVSVQISTNCRSEQVQIHKTADMLGTEEGFGPQFNSNCVFMLENANSSSIYQNVDIYWRLPGQAAGNDLNVASIFLMFGICKIASLILITSLQSFTKATTDKS